MGSFDDVRSSEYEGERKKCVEGKRCGVDQREY